MTDVIEQEWVEHRARVAAGTDHDFCNSCKTNVGSQVYLTEINPEGGHGRIPFRVCDPCMGSGDWDEWKATNWPNWPEKRE